MKRTTTFGFGSRGDFHTARQVSPPPTSYNIPSDFDGRSKKGNVFTFGASREAYSRVYADSQLPADKDVPGPGSYYPPKGVGSEGSKYSFRMRPLDIAHLDKLRTPGPGAYTSLTTISKNGFQFFSKFGSSGATRFNPPSSRRFQDLAQKLVGMPGPGQYRPVEQLSQNGRYFLAKNKSSLCRTFGREIRDFTGAKGTYMSKYFHEMREQ